MVNKPDAADNSEPPGKTELALAPKNRLLAGVSEFLLLFRLRARRTPTQAAGVMQRALHMVLVTCDNWFGRRKPSARPGPDQRD